MRKSYCKDFAAKKDQTKLVLSLVMTFDKTSKLSSAFSAAAQLTMSYEPRAAPSALGTSYGQGALPSMCTGQANDGIMFQMFV